MTRFLLRVTVALGLLGMGAACDRGEHVEAGSAGLRVEVIATGLEHPWSLAFLPDGRMLVTERPGRLRIVSADGGVSEPLTGVPPVFARGQGGLLDVALAPDFDRSRAVYFTYAEPGGEGASTAVARGRLGEKGLEDVEVVFRQEPKIDGRKHFGSRLVFAPDGTLFVTLGDRYQFDPAQDLSNHLGKIVRIRPDGSAPPDNPFVGNESAKAEIWSYGHRNIEGAALHPETGQLWIHEMGPRGGDELNIPRAGENHGWPLVSWGRHYNFIDIPDPPTRPDLAQPIYHWNPSIAPSGMTFYTSMLFDGWTGNLLIGGLASRGLVRLVLEVERVVAEERIPLDARVREVRQGPDGALYVLTDAEDGALLRLTPGNAM